MRRAGFFLLISLIVASAIQLRGQNVTTMGKDFWLSFMRGRIEATMSVTITGKNACTGTISNESGWSQTFSVPANGSVSISVDTSKSYNYVSNAITNKGLHIVTTDTVSVYASNYLSSSFDVTYVLPTSVLRDEYMAQTFETWKTGYQSEILIVATEDSTIVDIYPEASTINLSENSNFDITLNTGQCYLMQCSGFDDYSGTRIKARDCKRIAVFCGHHCAHIPVTTGSYCDHLFEQCIPVTYWGKKFVALMTMNHNGDYVKITSLKDSCTVYVGGLLSATIDAGESYSFTMSNTQISRYIETTQPAIVYTYMLSKNVAGPDGDPSMMLVPPIEQELKDVVFVNYQNSDQLTQYHYVDIVSRLDNISQIYLDGSAVSNYFQSVSGNYNYAYARISVNTGSHRLYSEGESGFIAHAYGVGANESYGYAVGFSAMPLNRKLIVNGNEFEFGDTIEVCFGDTLKAYVLSEDSIYVSGWLKEEAPFTVDDTLVVNCAVPGISHYKVVYSLSDGCFTNFDSILFVVLAHNTSEKQFDTTACINGLIWDGTLYNTTGSYMRYFTNQYGCDSIVTMSLVINNEKYNNIDYFGCDSVVIDGISYYSSGTVMLDTLVTSEGCDSIVIANITIDQSYTTDVNASILFGDTLIWIDGGAYCDENEHPTYNYHTVNGCDSVVRLNLHVIYPEIPPEPILPPPVDSSSLWVPNVFTPGENSNNLFCVYSQDLIEAHVYIYDRRGDYVTDFDGLTQCWNGTSKGRSCKGGTYAYLIEYKKKSMPRVLETKKGTITILK